MLSEKERQIVNKAYAIVRQKDRLDEQLQICSQLQADCARRLSLAVGLHDHIARIIHERTQCFPWLADAIAQYYELCDARVADYLKEKIRPAEQAALHVRRLAREKRRAVKNFRLARNRVRYYEALAPWLSEYITDDIDDIVREIIRDAEDIAEDEDKDPVLRYLPRGEYESLSSAERNQLALDRWERRKKRSWEIGQAYEYFVGYWFEQQGWRVEYKGATEGLSDLGRDLLARRGEEVLIIQCKRWREDRIVREKHIFQLYGTSVEYWLKAGGEELGRLPLLFPTTCAMGIIQPMFVTTTTLSEEASEYAQRLSVSVRERFAHDDTYPKVKCNVSRATGERIYHLPFDRQYPKTIIEPERGERYARTVQEAEESGFRRAWRWHPQGKD